MKFYVSFLLVVLLSIPAHAGQSLVFSYMGGRLSHGSLAVLKAAYAKIDIQIEGKILPAARALVESDLGHTDGEVHRIEAIEGSYLNLIRIKSPINTLEGLAVTCNDSIKIDTVESLNEYRVGIKTGNRYAEQLVNGMTHVTKTPDVTLLFDLLYKGRLDAVIVDRPWALLQKAKPEGKCLRLQEPPLLTIPLFHYLHKRHKALVPVITKLLKTMEESGESDAIRRLADKSYQPSIIE